MTARNRFLLALPPALVCSLTLIVLRAPGQQPPEADSQQRTGDKNGTAQAVKFSGRVTDTRSVPFGKSGSKRLMATVETTDGGTRSVDLGPATGKGKTVAKGDQITVSGEARGVIRVQRSEIVFASQLRAGGRTITITRPERTGQGRVLQNLSGTVTRTKQVDWRGSDRRELIVQLRTADGKQVVADLGPTLAVKDGKVKSGSSLTLRGRYADLGDYRVFFATEATCNDTDKTLTIRRDVPPFDGSKGPRTGEEGAPVERPGSAGGDLATITGSVRGSKEIGLKDGSGKNLILLVRAQNGKYALVDTGTVKTAQGYGFKSGDTVTASGRIYRVNDRPVLVADTVKAGGESHRISRPQKK